MQDTVHLDPETREGWVAIEVCKILGCKEVKFMSATMDLPGYGTIWYFEFEGMFGFSGYYTCSEINDMYTLLDRYGKIIATF